MPEDIDKGFPSGFLWGASTASHQVEGGSHSQWSVWELENASELAKTAEERLGHLPIWPEIKKHAKNPNNYVSGRGVDHYNQYKKDFDLAKGLNLNAFRFGISWGRIEPEEGKWDQQAIEHYKNYISELKKRGIEPMLNIWHWTFPVWFANKGGLKKYNNLVYLERYVKKIADEFGKDLNYVITINEPNVYASFSYLSGEWPPQEKNVLNFLSVYWNLAQAHKRIYKILKKKNPKLQVGIAAQLANIQAKSPHNIFDELATKWMRYFWNWWFLRRIRRHQDFIGINYYFTDYYTGQFKRQNPKLPLNDLGWYMEPEGLYPLLLRTWVRFKKPIIVTENGVADMHDEYRRWWIEETIVAMQRALSEGVDLRGYFHWSLLDNFEWKYGWWPKFGLVEVDREDGMKRNVRPSAEWFAGVIKKLSK
jgi:beta-glucosidase